MEQYLIPAISTVIVAIIEAIAAHERRKIKKANKADEERNKDQQELLILLVQSSGAAIALGEATAHAIQRGHSNGDMEAALEYATDIKHKQKDYLVRLGVRDALN